ncbi:protoheme IX farnesyltransferase [Virgibacillus campisalis]|uniref:Protoheme IX farnesyltransferase n=1 Tax=Virgibacillus alimentarius TaxID=698769 RepID=A0ABS4SAG9_9BACI|nr:protoheme IX farnesyltransferase [Virgibacillus alimentarius]
MSKTSTDMIGKVTDSNQQHTTSIISDIKSLVKGIVLISNVLPVLTGLALALYFTNASLAENWNVILLTLIGSTLVMAGALMLNNWYEVDLDKEMQRTEKRPTVTGSIPLKMVLTMGISTTILGFILLLFTTFEATVYAFIGWFTYVVLYTFWSKRKYTLNTIIGSVSGAVTPLIGWAAIESAYHVVPIVLALILFIWQIPHTFAIAIRRCDEYKAAGVPMLPVVCGVEVTKRQALIYIACLLPLPLFLTSLGTAFVVLASLLNVGWLALGISGLFTKDNLKWANRNFFYSLNYVIILFGMMIVFTGF